MAMMMFSRIVRSPDDALDLAVLGAQGHAAGNGVGGREAPHHPAGHRYRAAVGLVDAEQDVGHFRAPGAEQPCKPQHLAGVQSQIERLDRVGKACVRNLHERIRRDALRHFHLVCGHIGQVGNAAAEHQLDQLDAAKRSRLIRADKRSVPQDRDAVGDVVDLVEEVSDEDDRDAFGLQLPHHAEELFRLVDGEARRGLVEDQDLGILDDERSGDGRHLLDRNRIRTQRLGHVDVDLELIVEQCLSRPVQLLPVHRAEPGRLAADQEVLSNGEVRAQVDFLIDRANSHFLCMERAADDNRPAIEGDRAAVRMVHAGQHLDQRRLACTVFAYQGVDFALCEREVHVLQSMDAWERFRDPGHHDDVVVSLRHG
jgi:hypothetical protein